ncbi:hypothetical protein F2P79_011920 [Pimephales promelas]|nr:hypothetical protein F2P79_011920 [Pimephales promelas]
MQWEGEKLSGRSANQDWNHRTLPTQGHNSMETTLFALKAYYLGIQYLCPIRTAWPKLLPSLKVSSSRPTERRSGDRQESDQHTTQADKADPGNTLTRSHSSFLQRSREIEEEDKPNTRDVVVRDQI